MKISRWNGSKAWHCSLTLELIPWVPITSGKYIYYVFGFKVSSSSLNPRDIQTITQVALNYNRSKLQTRTPHHGDYNDEPTALTIFTSTRGAAKRRVRVHLRHQRHSSRPATSTKHPSTSTHHRSVYPCPWDLSPNPGRSLTISLFQIQDISRRGCGCEKARYSLWS